MFEELGLAEAEARAKDGGKLLLIDFTAEWCGPCKQMDRTTWKDPAVHAWVAEHAIALQLNTDANEAVAREWNIQALPTVVLRKGEVELDRASGLRSASQLIKWLDQARAARTELDGLREASSTDVRGRFLELLREECERLSEAMGDLPDEMVGEELQFVNEMVIRRQATFAEALDAAGRAAEARAVEQLELTTTER